MAKQAVCTEYKVMGAHARQEITIAHVSDLHERNADDVLEHIKNAKPDFIVITGDTFERYGLDGNKAGVRPNYGIIRRIIVRIIFYINYILLLVFGRKNTPETEKAYRFLSEAAKIAPVYMSLGNHEEYLEDEDVRFLLDNNITLLDNSDVFLEIKGARLYIGGLSSVPDEEWLEDFSHRDGYKLLLCHEPDFFEAYVRDRDINLTLSGHNHGGQVKLFGRGVMSAEKQFFPKLDDGYFYDRLIISAGCSNTAAIPRWNNPRELVVIILS